MGRHDERPGGIAAADLGRSRRSLRADHRAPWWIWAEQSGCHPIPAATLIARHLAARAVDDITGGG